MSPETQASLPAPKYALITPVHNEERFVGAMIDSILEQTLRPARWIIVDDGSTDATPALISNYANSFDFIDFVQLPRREERKPGGEGAITSALRNLDLRGVSFLGRFDADLLFPPDYIGSLLHEFHLDPELGIAGGDLYIEVNGRLQLEKQPKYHVRGAVKMYRQECFADIGGLCTHIGWDTIDEVSAWAKGWKTRSFEQYRVLHRRPTGLGLQRHRAFMERGKADYFTWSSTVFVLGKAVKIAFRDRDPVAAFWHLTAFFGCHITRRPRRRDHTFIYTRRKQQRERMLSILRFSRAK